MAPANMLSMYDAHGAMREHRNEARKKEKKEIKGEERE